MSRSLLGVTGADHRFPEVADCTLLASDLNLLQSFIRADSRFTPSQ